MDREIEPNRLDHLPVNERNSEETGDLAMAGSRGQIETAASTIVTDGLEVISAKLSEEETSSQHSLSPKVKKVAMHSAFITVGNSAGNSGEGLSSIDLVSYKVSKALSSGSAEAVLGVVVMIDISLSCMDIDARAQGVNVPQWVEQGSLACLMVYTIEFMTCLAVRRWKTFDDQMAYLDLGVLLIGYFDMIVQAIGISVKEIGMIRILRILRTFRLIRVVRKFHALKELRKLMTMFTSCLKTLLWSFTFLFVAMTIWSMLAVELVHPVIQDLMKENGLFADCSECGRSFESVMRANLTLFKTVVAGDSWGTVAVPVIEARPWTILVFAGSEMSLLYGLLQLVVAVVVDTAAEFRQKDVMSLAMDMDADQLTDLKFLTRIFKQIDEDNSGELELEELIKGAETVPEFQSRLRVMDIDKADLEQLFYMLDEDSGGSISPEEFKYALSRWLHDSKTATRFVKHNSMQILEEQRMLRKVVIDLVKRIDKSEREDGVKKPKRKNLVLSNVESTPESLSEATFESSDSFQPHYRGQEPGLALEARMLKAQFERLGLYSSERSAHMETSRSSNERIGKDSDKLAVCDRLCAATEQAERSLTESIHTAMKSLHATVLAATEQALQELRRQSKDTAGSQGEINLMQSTDAKNSNGLEELQKNSQVHLHQGSAPAASDSLSLTDIVDAAALRSPISASRMQQPNKQSSELEEHLIVV